MLPFPSVRICSTIIALLIGSALDARPVFAAPLRVGPALARQIAAQSTAPVVVWVTFTDRAGAEREPAAFAKARGALTARALDRRARRGLVPERMVSDLPVHDAYVRAVTSRGARLRGASRWLNAASFEMTPALAAELAALPFVARVDLVPRGVRNRPVGALQRVEGLGSRPAGRVQTESSSPAAPLPGEPAYYGGSLRQNSMMQVPELHAQGYTGAGVLVCMLDSGFRTTHRAFSTLSIVAKRDFVHGDTNVDDELGQDVTSDHDHGTWTLSNVAATLPGVYSGAAFGATVALGKTENGASETPVEMDYWQFGAEWADSLGADVISSSLGYSEFDNSADSYTYADMNGRTTVVTLAAAEAARRGITVVTAAGNTGNNPDWPHIIAPGDGDTVITVGAVDSFNVVTGFSSRGPTSDGRTKPDLTAMGSRVLLVSSSNDSTYVRQSGTSFATPLTTGVVALLLEAHPTWGPFEVREALRETAQNHASPNNDIGWGLVRGLDALGWVPSTTAVTGAPSPAAIELAAGPNPVRTGVPTLVRFSAAPHSAASLDAYDLSGRRRARLYRGPIDGPRTVAWKGADDAGVRLGAGVYWLRLAVQSPGRPPSTRSIRIVLTP